MKSYRTLFKNKYAMCIYGILLISSFLPALLAVKNIKISPDSMIYALISQEILSGNGIKLPIIIDLEDRSAFINGAVTHVEEPPLLPILFAILGGVTPQNFIAAQIINVISHVAISIFTFLLMKRLYDNNVIALLTGLLVSISYPLLWDAHHMLSESLFIALTVAALYYLILSRHSDSCQLMRYLFIASICTSAAVLTRYAGIALIPVFLWGTFILLKNKRIKFKYVSTILTTILPVITTVALFAATYIMSGTILGRNPPSPERSYFSALSGTIKITLLQFELGERPITLITILGILFILYVIANSNARNEVLKYAYSGLDLILVFIISYTVLISLAMTKAQTVFELRFMHPVVPFLFILCVLIIVLILEIIRIKGFSRLSLYGLILSLAIIAFGNCYKTYMHTGDFSNENGRQYFVPNSHTFTWLRETYEEDVVITTNKSFPLSFFGGYSTVQLPHKRFQKNFRIREDMELFLPDRMSKFGSRVLALFEEVDEQHEGSYLAELFNKREADGNFILLQQFPDGVVYQLKK